MREAASVPSGIAALPDLGKFTLLEQIGEGGMARIYLARARGIGGFEKLVVVKQILPRLAEDADFIARFFQEARLAATLDHPNIAAVYEVDGDRDTYFYSMEYVRGRDLQKVLRRAKQVERTLSLDEIVAIVTNLCAGLHHAHTRSGPDGRPLGIVHRDVSPSNVLISFEGAVKLADFGVAKARTGMVSTVAGTLRGKIAYMSPEQCRGEALDRRSDVHAVGVLMWEMLTGQRLHQGESELGIVRRIAECASPSPRAHRPDLPEELERVVTKALALLPADRYSSAHALQADLEEHARATGLALSARTIAALMRELFPDEELREAPAARIAPTMPIRVDDPERDRITPATATVAPPRPRAPVVAPPRPRAPVIAPSEAEHEPALESGPRRGGFTGLAVGLALGIALGGGGLWLALDDTRTEPGTTAPGPDAAPTSADAPADQPRTPAPIDAAGAAPPVAHASSRGPEDERAAAPEAEPTPSTEPAPKAEAAPVPAASEPASARPRKKAKRRRTSTKPRPLNLDSPLPPGFDAG